MNETIAKRQEKDKTEILKHLKDTSIVQVACARTGVSRATYYRWYHDDPEFSKVAEKAIEEGERYFCDLAESELINLIKEKNLGAIIFYLKVHHPKYSLSAKNKFNLSGTTETPKKITVSWEDEKKVEG